MQDLNDFENPNKVKVMDFTAFEMKGEELKVTLPPFSVVVIGVE